MSSLCVMIRLMALVLTPSTITIEACLAKYSFASFLLQRAP
jgi:hypothetical protein